MKRAQVPKVNEKQALIHRAYRVAGLLFLLAVLVIGKLVYVQYFDVFQDIKNPKETAAITWAERAEHNNIRLEKLPAMRGNIYANDESLLATSLPFYYVGLDTHTASAAYFNANFETLLDSLAQFFGPQSRAKFRNDILKRRSQSDRHYLSLTNRPITYKQRLRIEQWPFFDPNKRRGGKFDVEYRRYHPFSPMADRTIGTFDRVSGVGTRGLEASFNTQLSGTDGISWVQLQSDAVRVPLADAVNVQPEPGYDIHTTLDINFQDVAESALKKSLDEYQANFGCVVVMEVATGKIKALSNLTRKGPGNFVDDNNYALTLAADPGSTFKLATMMAVLEETGIDPDKVWVDTGKNPVMVYRRFRIRDAHRVGFGKLTASEVLEKSSNIGTHLLMQKYFYDQPDKYLAYIEKFRLKNLTGLHMKGEAVPFIRDRNTRWYKTALTAMSYGYDMRLAPIQILAFYNAVANGGYWVRPMIVDQVRNSSEVVNSYEPYVTSKPICSPRTAKYLQNMLEGVVLRGTAPGLKDTPYRVAGKTGTAQKIVSGQYLKSRGLRASFVGYFPADRPKYSCIVMVDNSVGGGSDLYAGTVAAPVFKQVADRIYAYDLSLHQPAELKPAESGVPVQWAGRADEARAMAKALHLSPPPEAGATADGKLQSDSVNWLLGSTGAQGKTSWKTSSVAEAEVPDLRGMALRDALYIMENKGFRVSFKGAGKVVSQSLEPGSKIDAEKKILLELQ